MFAYTYKCKTSVCPLVILPFQVRFDFPKCLYNFDLSFLWLLLIYLTEDYILTNMTSDFPRLHGVNLCEWETIGVTLFFKFQEYNTGLYYVLVPEQYGSSCVDNWAVK